VASRIVAPRSATVARGLDPELSPYAHTAGVGKLLEHLRADG
jgi:hypothetical protein